MGIYLNSIAPCSLYQSETRRPYFVDKSRFLEKIFPMLEEGNSHICITRPRRFGKTVMANMLGAFLSRGMDAKAIFDLLDIARTDQYHRYLNQYNVIYIDFSKMDDTCSTYEDYISTIKILLREDLREAYPEILFREYGSVQEDLVRVFAQTRQKFVFVFDEWDCIFHKPFIHEEDKRKYISFLSSLLKDQPYVTLSYMTGILPIAKYSSGSELNMFLEYTMASEEKFSEDFGFTDQEVDMLYQRYVQNMPNPNVTREGLRFWYDGYYAKSGERLYNPRSVVASLSNNNLGSYWTSSGPYDEIFYYIEKNVADVRNDLALMVSGEEVDARIQEYAATSMNLSTKDEIFSAMVVYGFLSYHNGKVCIPNKELMEKFDEMLRKEPAFGYMNRLAQVSQRMLRATLEGDTATMEEILEYAHNTETPVFAYNHETELSAIVNLVYLSAREQYRIEREDKAGIGYVDFIFYPEDKSAAGIILELKVDHSPEAAIQQIKNKRYAMRFLGKLGEQRRLCGKILAVGISYDRKTKHHQCRVEILNEER